MARTRETRAGKAGEAVAVICDGLRGDLIARGVNPAKIIVSPNGVDLDLFGDPPPRDAALAARLGLGDGDAVIGFIGSFYDYEGIDDLIAAMPALAAAQPRARLLLVRSEEHTSELQSLMRISYAVFCLKKKKNIRKQRNI